MLIEAVLISWLGTVPATELKCPRTHSLPGFPDDAAVVLIDGEIRGNSLEMDLDELDTDDVSRLAIICWNPETDELPARNGVQLIVITTKGLVDSTRAEIREAIESLRRFSAANHRAPGSLARLDLSSRAAARMEYTHSDSGWTVATAGPRAFVCSASGTDFDGVEVTCQVSHELAKLNLREAYAQNGGRTF